MSSASLAEFFSTTRGDDMGKVTIIEKILVKEKFFNAIVSVYHYTSEPTEYFIFILSEDGGLFNIFAMASMLVGHGHGATLLRGRHI